MGMTIAEKILARASGAAKVSPGEIAVVEVGTAVLIDMDFIMRERAILKVAHPERVVVVFDHEVPATSIRSARGHQVGRDFVREFGIGRVHDVGANQGISHALVMDRGYALPGSVLVCCDSHTCAAGAFNCVARGVGGPDMLYTITTGKTWFRVGSTVRYDLEGELPFGVSAKDVFLHIAGKYGDHTNQNVEYGGSALPSISINARLTMAAMGAELSAEFVTFEPDDLLINHVQSRNPTPFEPQYPDADASYAQRRTIRLDQMEPMVAKPDAVINNTVPVGEVAGERIDQAFIGSCANGTLDDLAEAARVVAGRQVAPGVRFIVTPGTQEIFRLAAKAGYVQTLMDAGAVVTPSTCGACFGGSMGLLGPGETCITASTRNFKGRMGDPGARIFMASPATVAASAIAGHIAHPGSAK